MSTAKVKCVNCGREIKGINAAKNDGWLIEGEKEIYCCCACKYQYSKKAKKK